MADQRAEQLLALAEELGLTDRQRNFCHALAADEKHNATKAAIAAGYAPDSARQRAAEQVQKSVIRRYLAELYEITGTGPAAEIAGWLADRTEVLEVLTSHLRADIRDVLDEDGNIDLARCRRLKKTGIIKSVRVRADKDGMPDITVTLHDAQAAAQLLGRHYALWTDVVALRDLPKDRDGLLALAKAELERIGAMAGPAPPAAN